MKMKKFLSVALAAAMTAGLLAGCGSNKTDSVSPESSQKDDKGSVYYLSFKPEPAEQWTYHGIRKARWENSPVSALLLFQEYMPAPGDFPIPGYCRASDSP